MKTRQRPVRRDWQDEFAPEEVREILRRAAELQQEMDADEPRVPRTALEAGAQAAGISLKALQRAIDEFRARRRPQRRWSWGKVLGVVVAALVAAPVVLFTLGVVGFTFSVVMTVFAAVGLALLVAAVALVLAMPFAGIGLLVGLLAAVKHWFKPGQD
ncbi:hypothetical protein HRbin17_00255 [bacterium HR17]|jgi:Mg/Co/Ni transporter MgtE|uniref:Uncharacterized protein n=1 Tax=Candidatus Fervidibacter japonicus TaxID=2035412 RepID=A0A2H5X9C9_9BACT|nr:hypothetical protein HRbin17_00255 [bacterium HR17]